MPRRNPNPVPQAPSPAPADIRSYQSSPGFTQVETSGPGISFTSPGMGMQNYGQWFNDLLRAKMDFERWKIQQQMRMQQQAMQAPQAMARAAQQRSALQGSPAMQAPSEGIDTFVTHENPLTPFTGLQVNPWSPGMRTPSGQVPVYTGRYANPVAPAQNPGADWLKYFNQSLNNPTKVPVPQEPETRADWGSLGSYGK